MTRVAESARWFLFAVQADDARRATYARWIARFRRGEVEARQRAASTLAAATTTIPQSTGYVACPPGTLGGVDAVVAEVQRLRDTALRASPDTKPYLVDYPITALDASSPLLRFALSDDVLVPASQYLGLVPILTMVTVLASPYLDSPQLAGSQLFHCDWEDRRQVKVFVHCSDVADANGPLTAVAADASTRVKRAVGYHYGGPAFRLRDDDVLPRVDTTEVTPFVGPAGAVTFLDTSSCLHYGSRVQPGAHERLVLQLQFLTPTAFDLVRLDHSKRPFRAVAGDFSPQQRLALGATP
ncbi:MAG TPA: hypothetical protein VHC63_08915 [Acidimicrobiales bacterium]|nr:hypothetical protein [Acidimicrobiales bacterium]